MSTKKLFFVAMTTVLFIILFAINTIRGNLMYCSIIWFVGGIIAFQINVGTLFRNWRNEYIWQLTLFTLFGLLALLISTSLYFSEYLARIQGD